jgi:WD40 repeat protein
MANRTPTSKQLQAAVERLLDGRASEADRDSIRQALNAGRITLAAGERSVAIGGNASDAIIVPGDRNIVVQGAAAAEAIRELLASVAQRQRRKLRRGVNMAERPPDDFVARPAEFDELLALLLDSRGKTPVAITAALRGAGGFGKTTLAQALCWDGRVTEQFSGAILWVTLGENPGDLTGKVLDLVEKGTGERPGFTELRPALDALKEVTASRRSLLVIDDVWNEADLRPFLHAGLACSLLITTRIVEVLPATARQVKVDAMRQEEATDLMGRGLPAGGHEREMSELAGLLGNWPVLLRLANGVLRYRVNGANESIDNALAWAGEAYRRQGPKAFDARNAKQRDQAVSRTLGVSFDVLTEAERARYRELAVFPEDVDVPVATLAKYWARNAGLDAFETDEICAVLSGLSLLRDYDAAAGRIRLHDVMRKYLIDQSGTGLPELHRQLIEAHRPPSGRWADLADDEPYMWDHLALHLTEAGLGQELAETVKDLGYLARKAWVRDSLAAEQDLRAAFETAPGDVQFGMLARSFAGMGHLLNRGNRANGGQVRDLMATLHSRVWHLEELRPLAERLEKQIPRAYLTSWHPLPDLPHPSLIRTLAGHAAPVNGCAISPDGSFIVSASLDKTLKVWDAKTGKERLTLTGHTHWVESCAISPDGSFIVSASRDHTLKVWDASTGEERITLTGHTSQVNGCAISPDGSFIVSASDDETLKVWDARTGKGRLTLTGHARSVEGCAISPDGSLIVSASWDDTLKVWDVVTGKERLTLAGHAELMNDCAISPDGSFIVSASGDGTLKVWDARTGKARLTLIGHTDGVNGCAISPDGLFVVSASGDNTLKVWDATTGKERFSLTGHTSWVNGCAIAPDGSFVVSASWDKTLKVWDTRTAKERLTRSGHTEWVNRCAINTDGSTIVSASLDNTLKVWDARTGKERLSLTGHAAPVEGCAIGPDGLSIVSASQDRTLKVWDAKTGKERLTLTGHTNTVNGCAISPDGSTIVSASLDDTLKVWDARTGKERLTLTGHAGPVNGCAISPDGSFIVSASRDKTLKAWDARGGGKERFILNGHTDSVYGCAISPDGSFIVSASLDKTLRVWDARTGKGRLTLFGHTGSVLGCAISPDASFIVSASGDHALKVWNVASGDCLATFYSEAALLDCAWSRDGEHIVVAGRAGVYFLRFVR